MSHASQDTCDTDYGYTPGVAGCYRFVDRGDGGRKDMYDQPTTGVRELDIILEKETDLSIKASLKDKRIRNQSIAAETTLNHLGSLLPDGTGSIVHATLTTTKDFKDDKISSIQNKRAFNYDTVNKKLISVDELLSKNDKQKLTNDLKKDARCPLLSKDIFAYSFVNADNAGKIQSLLLYPCINTAFSIKINYPSLRLLPDESGCKIMKGSRYSWSNYDYSIENRVKITADLLVCNPPLPTGVQKLDAAINTKEKQLIQKFLQPDSNAWEYRFYPKIVNAGRITSVFVDVSIPGGRGKYSSNEYLVFNYNKSTGKFLTLEQVFTKKEIATAAKKIISVTEAKSYSWTGEGSYNPYGTRGNCTQQDYTSLFNLHTNDSGKVTAITFYNQCASNMLPIKLSYPSFELIENDK